MSVSVDIVEVVHENLPDTFSSLLIRVISGGIVYANLSYDVKSDDVKLETQCMPQQPSLLGKR